MFCPYCRTVNPDTAASCTHCQAVLPKDPGKYVPPPAFVAERLPVARREVPPLDVSPASVFQEGPLAAPAAPAPAAPRAPVVTPPAAAIPA
ncbi:MAG: hypothetical protein AB2A00_27155, partial [Myxococcota bacterium]